MANYFSKITMPDGSIADIRDRSAMHWLGKTTTPLSDQAPTLSIVVGSITYSTSTTTETATAKKLRAYDYVTYGTNNESYIFDGTKWHLLSEASQTIPITDVQVDGTSIVSSTVAEINTTGSYNGDSSSQNYNPIATKGYVDNIVNALPEPMIFKGTLGKGTSNPTITSLPAPASTGANKNIGFTYKVIDNNTYTINTSPTTTITAEDGDTVISDGTSWVLVPSGDEPGGTVTSIYAGVGLTAENDNPITHTGTIKAKLVSETAVSSSDGNIHNVGVNSSNQLVVSVKSTDPYNGTTNPYATKNFVENAINDLDVTGASGIAADQTISAWSEENGKVSITTQGISITTSKVSDIDSVTSTASSVSASPSSSTSVSNQIVYCSYDASSETLTLNKIVSAPVGNLLTKTTS